MKTELSEFQKEKYMELYNKLGKEKVVEINNTLGHLIKTFSECGIKEFYTIEMGQYQSEFIDNFACKYEADKFAEFLPKEEVLTVDIGFDFKVPASTEVIDKNLSYFTNRLIHLYEFKKKDPTAIDYKKIEESISVDKKNEYAKSVQVFLIANFLLYDKGGYDVIDSILSRHISQADEKIYGIIKFTIILKLCEMIMKTFDAFAKEEMKSSNPPLLYLLCANHSLINVCIHDSSTLDMIEEMVVFLKQQCNL